MVTRVRSKSPRPLQQQTRKHKPKRYIPSELERDSEDPIEYTEDEIANEEETGDDFEDMGEEEILEPSLWEGERVFELDFFESGLLPRFSLTLSRLQFILIGNTVDGFSAYPCGWVALPQKRKEGVNYRDRQFRYEVLQQTMEFLCDWVNGFFPGEPLCWKDLQGIITSDDLSARDPEKARRVIRTSSFFIEIDGERSPLLGLNFLTPLGKPNRKQQILNRIRVNMGKNVKTKDQMKKMLIASDEYDDMQTWRDEPSVVAFMEREIQIDFDSWRSFFANGKWINHWRSCVKKGGENDHGNGTDGSGNRLEAR